MSFLSFDKIIKTFVVNGATSNVLSAVSGRLSFSDYIFLTAPNGRGKTVLCKILAGIIGFDKGTIVCGGRTYTSESWSLLSAKREGVFYLPQFLQGASDITAMEFVAGFTNSIGLINKRRIRDVVDKYTGALGWHDIESRRLNDLSRKQLLYTHLLAILVQRPKFVFLDEPLANLDPDEAKEFCGLTRQLSQQNEIGMCIVAHPQQLFYEKSRFFWLNSSSLSEVASSSFSTISVIEPEKRVRPRSSRSARLMLTDSLKDLEMSPGQIISVRGPLIRPFSAFPEAISIGGTRYPFIDVKNFTNARRPLERISIRRIPFESRNSDIFGDLSALENNLIWHWTDPRWYKASDIIRRKCYTLGSVKRATAEAWFRDEAQLFLPLDRSDPSLKASLYSGGNRQKIVIRRALMGNPTFVVAGGIFGGLDDEGIRQVVKLIERAAAAGTVFVLFHNTGATEGRIADQSYEYGISDVW